MKKTLILFAIGILNLGLVFVPLNSHADATSLSRGVNMTFDVMPGVASKTLPANKKIQAVLKISLDVAKFSAYCEDNNTRSLKWTVYQDVPLNNGADDNLGEKVVNFQRTGAIVDISSSATVTANTTWSGNNLPDPLNFYGFIECPDGTNVAQSANVSVYWANLSYTCIVPNGPGKYAYSCSPGNLSNCSDNPQCSGKCESTQIPTSLCGSPAPAPGGGGGGCGGAGQQPCPVGSTSSKSYSFNITNPLAGSPNDLFGIIDVITQWIMYISIPLAVLFIMYAGFLMLTAGPFPEHFKKGQEILKYTVLGLAIIFIGKGFVSLIISVIELGGTTSTTQDGGGNPPPGPLPPGTPSGIKGSYCTGNSQCNSGLVCKNTMCQAPQGNSLGEACLAGINCDTGFTCDNTSTGRQYVDGRAVGSCIQQSSSAGKRVGETCSQGSECVAGLKCDGVCQRQSGNLEGEICSKESNCYVGYCTVGVENPGICRTRKIGQTCSSNRECETGNKCNVICQRQDGNFTGEACNTTASRNGDSNCASGNVCAVGGGTSGTCVVGSRP